MNGQRRPARNAAATNLGSSQDNEAVGRLADLDRVIDVRERLVASIDELEAGAAGVDACRALIEGLLQDFDLAVSR